MVLSFAFYDWRCALLYVFDLAKTHVFSHSGCIGSNQTCLQEIHSHNIICILNNAEDLEYNYIVDYGAH